jgi:hypothetical protein
LERNWRRKEDVRWREGRRDGKIVKGDRWGNPGEKRRDERRTNKKVRMGIGIRGLEGL